MSHDVNPRYKGLADYKLEPHPWQLHPPPKGKTSIQIGLGDASEWGFRNDRMWSYLAQIAKDPKYAKYSSHFRPTLLDSISTFEKKFRNVEVTPDHIIVAAGVAGCYVSLHNVLLSPGDQLAIPTPAHYFWFPTNVPYLGIKKIAAPAIEEEGWKPDFDGLRKKITPKTKAIGITSPVNPTGRVYTEKELKEFVNIAGEFNIPIISDEIEGIIAFGVESISMARVAGDVPCITVSSVSKAFGSPGWAVGYLCFHDPLEKIKLLETTVKAFTYSYGHSGHRLPSPIIVAVAKAFEEGWWIPDIVSRVEKQREYAWTRLNEIEGISCVKSRGTFWLFPRVHVVGKAWKRIEDFILNLWLEEGLGVIPGTGFGEGGTGHFRVTNLPPINTLEEAYNRLERFLTRHA